MFDLKSSNKWKIFFLLILITFTLIFQATAKEQPITIVYNSGVAPLKFEDEFGYPLGLFPDIWRLWASKVGKSVRFIRKATFEDSLAALQNGEADFHAGLFKTHDRELFIQYSEPILTLDYYIFTHPAVRPIASIEETTGLIVGIQKGGFTESWIRTKIPPERIACYDTFTDLFKAARKGQIKVFIATELSLFYDLNQNRMANIFAYNKQQPLYSQIYYAATAKKNADLIKLINKGLSAISLEERNELEKKWIVRKSKQIPPEFSAILTDEEQDFLSKVEIIKVNNETDWAPFNFNENGIPKGFSIDYISMLAEKTGLDIQFVNYPTWNEFLSMMKSGELDVMLNIAKTPERENYLIFTPPYIEAEIGFFSRIGAPPLKNITDLFGKIVAVPKGYYVHEVLKQYPEIKILALKDATECLKAVSSEKADGTIGLIPVIVHLIREQQLSNIKYYPDTIKDLNRIDLCIAVSKDKPVLGRILEKGMSQLSAHDIRVLKKTWLGSGAMDLAISLTHEEIERVKKYPILRMAPNSFAPYEYFSEDGKYVGLVADYMKILSEKLGIQFIAEKGLKPAEAIQKINQGKIDILPCIELTYQQPNVLFTNPYLFFFRAIFTRGDFQVTDISHLKGRSVGVQKNSSHHKFLEEFPDIIPVFFDTIEDALMALSIKKIDAVVGNLAEASYVIRKYSMMNINAIHASYEVIPLAIGVRKELSDLVPVINKALSSISEEEHLKIRNQWMDVNIMMKTQRNIINFTEEEKDWIKNHPVIRVSNELDYPPFDFVENGQAVGFSIDYLRLLADRIGLQLIFVQDTWENLQEMGKEKKIDLLHSIFRTSERLNHFLFTEPYKTVTFASYVRDDAMWTNTFFNLSKKKIALVKGDGIIPNISKMLPNAEIILFDTYEEAVKSVSVGRTDATVMDSAVANYLIRQHTLTNIVPAGEANLQIENKDIGMYRIAVRNDWQVLHKILQKAMNTITPEEFVNLELKWFGKTYEKIKIIPLTSSEQAFIASHSLIFSEVNWKPLSITDNPEKYDGMIADYFKIISERTGLKFVFKKTETDTWAEVLQSYVDGKIDVVPALGKDDVIGREILLSEPFVSFPLIIVTRNDVSYIRHVSELYGRKVAVGKGYTSYHYLKKYHPDIQLVETDNVEQGLIKVSNNEVFAFVDHMAIVVDSLQRLGMKNLKIAGEAGYQFDHRIGVDPKYPLAISIINKALASITEQEHREIYRRWLYVTSEKTIDYSLAWKVTFAATIFVICVLYWNRKLAALNQTLNAQIMERIKVENALKENEKELVKAKEAAEAASHAKTAFLANMSHEIRTPMNSVMGFLSLAIDDPSIPEKQRKYLKTAYQSSKALLNVINDILDVSKLERGKLELEDIPFDLTKIIKETIHTLKITAISKGLSLEVVIDDNIPQTVMGDAGRIKQILMNIVGNAIKFTQKGYVRLEVRMEKNGEILFSISDSGIGIPKDRLNKIFEPFTQADSSTTRRFGGTGLGTTISKQLVELMGGKIWVESEEGKGSTFYFTINLKPTTNLPSIEPKHTPSESSQYLNVLVAEDVEENISLIKIRLEACGHRVIIARNGHEAIKMFERESPDIILMDVHMPEMDGIEATTAIRKIENERKLNNHQNSLSIHTPIIALTASVMKNEREVFLGVGMDAVVAKPIDFDELFSVMGQLIPVDKQQTRAAVVPVHTYSESKKQGFSLFSIKGIDPIKGLKIWRNEDMYKKALMMFCRDFEFAGEQIASFIKEPTKDKEELSRFVHKLKGVSGNLAMNDIYQLTCLINSEIKEKPMDDLLSAINSLISELDSIIDSLKSIEFEKQKPIETQIQNPEQLKNIFMALMASYDRYNPKICEPILDQLTRSLSHDKLDRIRYQLDRFDFDGAKEETIKLANVLGMNLINK